MSIINRCLAILCIYMYTTGVASSNDLDDKYRMIIVDRVIANICSGKNVQSRIHTDCKKYVTTISQECLLLIEPILPSLSSHEEAMKKISVVTNINQLFTYCVHAKIYQDITGVSLYK